MLNSPFLTYFSKSIGVLILFKSNVRVKKAGRGLSLSIRLIMQVFNPIRVLGLGPEDLAQDLLSSVEFQGLCICWLDVLAHK